MLAQWAGINSWLLSANPEQVITASGERAASPWVKTDSIQPPPRQLTAGSDLNRTAQGPWPYILTTGLTIDFNDGTAWVKSRLREISTVRVPGNYGSRSSLAKWYWRTWAFPENKPGAMASIGMLPGPIPNARRPMWNNMPNAQYNLRVENTTQAKFSELATMNSNAYPISGNPYNQSASIGNGGASAQEVLL